MCLTCATVTRHAYIRGGADAEAVTLRAAEVEAAGIRIEWTDHWHWCWLAYLTQWLDDGSWALRVRVPEPLFAKDCRDILNALDLAYWIVVADDPMSTPWRVRPAEGALSPLRTTALIYDHDLDAVRADAGPLMDHRPEHR